jgi:hypothetical protein
MSRTFFFLSCPGHGHSTDISFFHVSRTRTLHVCPCPGHGHSTDIPFFHVSLLGHGHVTDTDTDIFVLSWCMLAQHFPRSSRVPMLPTCTGGGGHVTRYKNGSCFWWLPSTYTTHFIAAHSASKRLSLQALTHQRGACAPSSGPPSFKHAGASARVHTYAATERFGGTEPACTSRVPVWLVRIPIPPASFSISPSPPEQHKRH